MKNAGYDAENSDELLPVDENIFDDFRNVGTG